MEPVVIFLLVALVVGVALVFNPSGDRIRMRASTTLRRAVAHSGRGPSHAPPGEEPPPPPGERCAACGGSLVYLGRDRIRTGGTTGGWKLLFGELAELGEDMLDLEFRACGACRRVELRLPGP